MRAADHTGPCAAYPGSAEDSLLDVNLRNIRTALNGEQARVKFIRDTAIALLAMPPMDGRHIYGAEEAWVAARGLWDAKPEDC